MLETEREIKRERIIEIVVNTISMENEECSECRRAL
jgi:hypothetical protein